MLFILITDFGVEEIDTDGGKSFLQAKVMIKMIDVLIGAGIYLLILYFAVRFFQTVHGWDEQMAGLLSRKEQSPRHERTARRKHT
jgi:hypothetical protein